MEQFREIGEVLGSIRALMVFKDNIQINQRQCALLLDLFTAAYDSISESMRSNLRFKEKNTKWKILEQPLRELLLVLTEGEAYVRMSLEPKIGFWAKAIMLHCNRDCTELHIHNLLSCLPSIIEAIETAGEVSGWDEEEMSKKKLVHSNKYMKQWNDSQMFTWKFGREYLVTEESCNRFESAWTEDRWILIKELQEKKQPGSSKHDRKMADFLFKKLGDGNECPKLFPSSLLVSAKDYQVKKRLGSGSQYKEITWLGESFALRHFFGDIDALLPQVTQLLSLSHPNIVYYLCGFTDEEKKECFLVTELMSKTLGTHIKEVCGPRKKNTLSLPVAVDLMLQIALGMEYLHSKKIYHGELNPSNILVKPRRSNQYGDGYHHLHEKIFGFGLNSVKGFSSKSASLTGQNENFPFIWYSPEVLEEQEQSGTAGSLKYTDKSDVYSFGMVCFELLTGKVPFEDSHLQGDKMSRNIRAGERPLFPFHSPRLITNLTKRCWHADPDQRPTFSSISRILRYIKRFLALNQECHSSSQQDPPIASPVDYCEIETKLLQKLSWETTELTQVSQVPFQMFAYRVVERARTCKKNNMEASESGSEWASCSEDEGGTGSDEQEKERRLSISNDVGMMSKKKHVSKLVKRASGLKPIKNPGTPRGKSRHPPLSPCGQSMRTNSESQLILISPKIRRTNSGHASDSELS
ncbi:PREDICTED: CBL-interacting serine/threonine-protein kinase 20-like [Camelina sativa]|uniref:CBL-interacting serine/threonine-protein kinase 20-like n=1 Tax=Camelina sativa TaxID=90675 RepID=A0ABM0X425_CAMSA|nr:PREDICTED: CBL-interacting serine/threonine-protein kinase 20-like [Camelina sativa]